jgi:hypothetical protein
MDDGTKIVNEMVGDIAKAASVAAPAVDKNSLKEIITDQLTVDGWIVLKSGFQPNGRAFILGRGPCEALKDVIEAINSAAACSHVVIENIQAGKRGESAPWQVDFTILKASEDMKIDEDGMSGIVESFPKDFMQSYMNKWRVGQHEWGSGAITCYLFKGIGDKQPDAHNHYDGGPGAATRKVEGAQPAADYLTWLEDAFMASEKFKDVKTWLIAADLAGMMKRWRKSIQMDKKRMEAMDPSELYQKSIQDNPISLKLKMEEMCQMLKAKGYDGAIQVKPSAAHPGMNLMVIWLFKPNTPIAPQEMRMDLEDAWGNKKERIIDMGFRRPSSVLAQHHQAFSLITSMGGYKMPEVFRKIQEGMDPSELYQQSLKGTLTATQLAVAGVSSDLAKKGYRGRFSIGIRMGSRGEYYHFHAYLQGVASEGTVGDITQDLTVALEAHGFSVDGVYDPRFQTSEDGPHLFDAHIHARVRTHHVIPEEGIVVDIASIGEGMDPSTLYQKSIEGQPLKSRLIVGEIAADLQGRGYKNLRVNIAPAVEPEWSTMLNVYLSGISALDADHSAIALDVLAAARRILTPRAHVHATQFFRLHADPQFGTFAIHVGIPIKGIYPASRWFGEAMEPGDLYQKSLAGTRTGAMIDMQKIADALTQDGFNGFIETSYFRSKPGEPVRVDYAIKRPNDLTPKDWHQLARRLYKSFQKTGLNGEGINLRIPTIPYIRHEDAFWFSQNVFLTAYPENPIKLPVGHGKIYAD